MNSIFITVRTGSSRLPKKALEEIGNRTTIEFLIDRLKLSSYADNIVLCTTTLDEDDVLIEIAKKKTRSWRGGGGRVYVLDLMVVTFPTCQAEMLALKVLLSLKTFDISDTKDVSQS